MAENPKTALARYRIEKAKEALSEAQIMLTSGHTNTSMSRSYYAIFHAAHAALSLKGVDSKKHSGVIHLFNLHFIKNETLPSVMQKTITSAKSSREKADYTDYATFSREEAENQLNNAAVFIEKVEALIK